MTEGQVDYIAHLLKEAKDKQYNKPIVFIGAGMSVTGGIPSAGEIANEILAQYEDNPKIKKLRKEDKTYINLMACLTTAERNALLNHYIDKAKVNVGYIYLAHLINITDPATQFDLESSTRYITITGITERRSTVIELLLKISFSSIILWYFIH